MKVLVFAALLVSCFVLVFGGGYNPSETDLPPPDSDIAEMSSTPNDNALAPNSHAADINDADVQKSDDSLTQDSSKEISTDANVEDDQQKEDESKEVDPKISLDGINLNDDPQSKCKNECDDASLIGANTNQDRVDTIKQDEPAKAKMKKEPTKTKAMNENSENSAPFMGFGFLAASVTIASVLFVY